MSAPALDKELPKWKAILRDLKLPQHMGKKNKTHMARLWCLWSCCKIVLWEQTQVKGPVPNGIYLTSDLLQTWHLGLWKYIRLKSLSSPWQLGWNWIFKPKEWLFIGEADAHLVNVSIRLLADVLVRVLPAQPCRGSQCRLAASWQR